MVLSECNVLSINKIFILLRTFSCILLVSDVIYYKIFDTFFLNAKLLF